MYCTATSMGPVRRTFRSETTNCNLQIYIYYVHALKRASAAPRTHFRRCTISKCSGAVPPDPLPPSLRTIHIEGPIFHICPEPTQSSRQPCMSICTLKQIWTLCHCIHNYTWPGSAMSICNLKQIWTLLVMYVTYIWPRGAMETIR